MAAVLELDGVSDDRILRGVTLKVVASETLALVGPSGAGKSTVLRHVLGFAVPTSGTVRIAGRIASDLGRIAVPPEERGLGVVFQDLALWPHMTIEGNLGFAAPDRDRIAEMLERVGLADKARRYPGELSGGERQRAAIARALVTSPALILLDEPLASLDVVLRDELVVLFRELLRDRTVLYVTHDPREVAALADRVAAIEGGAITQTGTPAELVASPATPFVERVAALLANAIRDGVSARAR
jgi:iron(III) transport system ATP-binding protein